MILQTQIPLKKVKNPIDYNSKILLLGSCFSENMGQKLVYYKFQVAQNPFGILFHPLAVEKVIIRAIKEELYTEKDVFLYNERWYCFDAHSEVSAPSAQQLVTTLNAALQKTKEQLTKASHLFITSGTAWVYRKKDTNQVVANCHKVPQNQFTKELLQVATIQKSLQCIIEAVEKINKNLELAFTLSPVRHIKDGFIENKRSKAHLLSAIHHVKEASELDKGAPLAGKVGYFPSYEIMMDELRDYRFYAQDMIHPSGTAMDYIWEKFKYSFLANTAYESMNLIETVQKGLAHRPFNPASEAHQKFLQSIDDKIDTIKKMHPFINFKP